MKKITYIAIDLHSKHSVIGYMDAQGTYLGHQRFCTTASNLVQGVVGIPGECKYLTIEQGNMAFWAGSLLAPYVERLIVCDPRQNYLISRSPVKNDRLDTYRLCKLLRLGELKAVYRPEQMGERRLFYHQIKEYERFVKQITIHKRQVTALVRHWGYPGGFTRADYRHPERWIGQISEPLFRQEVAAKTRTIEVLSVQRDELFARIQTQGRAYPEIAEFQKMPGMGPVLSHTFSGYVQTPDRFARKGQLIHYCQLGVRRYSSDGRRLKAERLDKAGHSSLKNLSYQAWKGAMKGPGNEVQQVYEKALAHTGNPIHARLITQRKILISLWSLWKHKESYRPERFLVTMGHPAD